MKYPQSLGDVQLGHLPTPVEILRLIPYGGFHKWGYPNGWMVYKGKSIYKWMIWGNPISGNLHMDQKKMINGNDHKKNDGWDDHHLIDN